MKKPRYDNSSKKYNKPRKNKRWNRLATTKKHGQRRGDSLKDL